MVDIMYSMRPHRGQPLTELEVFSGNILGKKERMATKHIQRQRAGFLRQARVQCRDAGDVHVTLFCVNHVAQNEMADLRDIDLAARDCLLQGQLGDYRVGKSGVTEELEVCGCCGMLGAVERVSSWTAEAALRGLH